MNKELLDALVIINAYKLLCDIGFNNNYDRHLYLGALKTIRKYKLQELLNEK
jgi:hypothetical protein